MSTTWRAVAVAVVAAGLALVGSGCGSSSPPAPASSAPTGTVRVFAAASLTEAFTSGRAPFMAANPGVSVTTNFAGSNTLVTQIRQGAPADVFASADTRNMQRLVDAGLVDTPVTFARNTLEIAVAPGNPKGVAGLADLARPGTSVVLGASGVPAGDYARQVLAATGITVAPKSLETDVKSAIAKVTSGEADATIVYATDVRAAGAAVTGVPIPAADQPDISYPIAVVKATKHRDAAEAFVRSAVSGDVQRALHAAGFSAP